MSDEPELWTVTADRDQPRTMTAIEANDFCTQLQNGRVPWRITDAAGNVAGASGGYGEDATTRARFNQQVGDAIMAGIRGS